jgi:hypothetical protein
VTRDEYLEVDVYCLRCKKDGKVKDLLRADGTLPFIYDGVYECEECLQKAAFRKAMETCPTCGK